MNLSNQTLFQSTLRRWYWRSRIITLNKPVNLETSSVAQDGKIKTVFIFPPKTSKKTDKTYENSSQHIGHQAMKGSDPWKMRNGWALRLPQLIALREFPAHSTRRGNPDGVWLSHWVEETGEAKVARVHRVETRERHRERTVETGRGPPLSIQLCIVQCLQERKLPEAGEKII